MILYPVTTSDEEAKPNEILKIANVDLQWGKELLFDKIPYLQPIYLHIESSLQRSRLQDWFGRVSIEPTSILARITLWLKRIALVLAVAAILLSLVTTGIQVLSEQFSLGFSITAINYYHELVLAWGIFSLIRWERPFISLLIIVYCFLQIS
ncbi:hypothetical protein [Rubeoparvulum massiliense]|uniref:hypothetical protein n=1 Tax=Rubeoparvulum massiliense TaxID=1631346 RepID=UPI00065E4D59|nr:hypothetical protein [Rubeoparvulum massiliense]